jgi:ZIP family zinc transporter
MAEYDNGINRFDYRFVGGGLSEIQVFQHGDTQLLSRTWLIDPVETQENASNTTSSKRASEPWIGEFYGSFGEGLGRSWEEARQYGFFSAGGGSWYSQTLSMLNVGDRIWVRIPKRGYVGVGIVEAPLVAITDFELETELNGNDNDNEIEIEEKQELLRVSMITVLAIAMHNFPEGLATFVSTLAHPKLGISITIAICIHNIPEGIAVAMPVYFATGNKMKAFCWALMSGIFEPIGALIGYVLIELLFVVFTESMFGVMFGFTAGLMIYISFKQLLPIARKIDVHDQYSTLCLFLGFLVIDVSLILFEYSM